ncbi:FabD/lysophospholipase-like protein [Lindgomyces ingoldianus]|uniref:FabD/lysophospholipase-like protein n=1 Tax=Lindgomyces ingoldianus TaxID=673940 RepID=A0ACB6QGB9_9PLEO|nr:FabD/lysophospholipase-like protein [Lindgomyces ingoldianus]KAF2465550.1 FabD/lysophospholipase-like protein [Lindgomyces ingoldianus]
MDSFDDDVRGRPKRAPPPPPPRYHNHPPQPQPDQGLSKSSDDGSYLPVTTQRRAPNGIRHEKTDFQLAQIMDSVFYQPTDEESYRRLFYEDRHTSWFGVNKDGPRLMFLDHGRYGEVMARTSSNRSVPTPNSNPFTARISQGQRTPSLVSLVGQTGAGKSTLVKLLIDLQHRSIGKSFPAPVIGMPGKDVPTSEGVHLYLDPGSAFTDAPLLYADCEGLDGGEREPISARYGRRESDFGNEREYGMGLSSKTRYTSEHELMWADSAFRRSREFIVTSLYPRLLYTFSDVIIFVLRNPRVIESVFEQLIDWAAVALETSSNQPALPHAIILLNTCELDVDDGSWDVETATGNLLDALSHTIHLNPTFQKYAQYWQERDKKVDSVKELMMCYYSSLRIVRMPDKSQPQLVQSQTDKLYQEIQTACIAARTRKAELRMLLDAGELQSYLQFAFEHFSARLDVPFDFVQASFLNNPIPSDFGGSILKLAIRMVEQEDDPDARVIFSKLSCMVASCIMLDSVRHKIKGNADSIFPLYLQHLEVALKDFCDRHWPCEFAINRAARNRIPKLMDNRAGLSTITKCVNVRSGHGSKGHQLADGRVFAAGEYVSDFSFGENRDEFLNMVYFRLEHLLDLLTIRLSNGEAEREAAKELHRDDVMAHFYGDGPKGGVRSVHSHSVCFCCLFESPEHCLPCGHILCTACIKTYGKSKDANTVEMYECPLETNAAGRYQPWTVHLKPESAGLRVLCLDSGGVRNVIQLEILRLLERELNGKLPIQCFFDLIVGSGTAGIIALGLGTRNWSVEECLDHFEKICAQAFANRGGRHIPGAGWLVESLAHAKYDSIPLEAALKEAFSDSQYLFGGPRHRGLSDLNVKVALATSTPGGNDVVLANYNRQLRWRDKYQFYRSENLAAEFKTWEVARACMATPRLFKPMQHLPSRQALLESGIHSQNPIHIAMNECRALLPSSSARDKHPDIILSLGSGIYSTNSSVIEPISSRPSRAFSIRSRTVKTSEYQILMAAHCQKIWDDHINSLFGSSSSSAFVRLNPEISENLTSFESHESMKLLRSHIVEQYRNDARIKQLAAQLIATLFYFETVGSIWDTCEDGLSMKGKPFLL